MEIPTQFELAELHPPIALKPQSITTAKIQRIALSCLGAVSLSISLMTHTLPPISLAGFVCTGLIYLFYKSIKDYENPKELRMMQIAASRLSFADLIKEHSLDKIRQYNIVSPETLQKKFYEHYETTPLSQIEKIYSFATIQTHRLASKETLFRLLGKECLQMHVSRIPLSFLIKCFNHDLIEASDLKMFHDFHNQQNDIQNNFQTTCQDLNCRYSKRTEKLLEELDVEKKRAEIEANQLHQKITDSGCKSIDNLANAQTTWDLIFTNKSPLNITIDESLKKIEGKSIVHQTAKEASDAFFLKRCEEIRIKKETICSYDIGKEDQKLYEQAIDQAKKDLAYQIEVLQKKFQRAIVQIMKID